MTVKKLIGLLKKQDPQKRVMVHDAEGNDCDAKGTRKMIDTYSRSGEDCVIIISDGIECR